LKIFGITFEAIIGRTDHIRIMMIFVWLLAKPGKLFAYHRNSSAGYAELLILSAQTYYDWYY